MTADTNAKKIKYEKLVKNFPMIYRHFKIDVDIEKVVNFPAYNDEKVSVNIMTNNDDNLQTWAFNTGVSNLGNRCTANLDPITNGINCDLM